MTSAWLSTTIPYDDGSRKIFSVREQAPDGADPDTFSTVVVLEWGFEEALPDTHLLQAMQVFEDLLDPLDDVTTGSFLVHVITGDGVREWCYYTRDYAGFMAAKDRLLAGQRHFPIDVEYQEHADWSYWEDIREFVQEAVAED